jgi:hypothetical protein
VKLLLNSVISTPGARFATFDLKYFYLGTPMTRKEYMRTPLASIPQSIIDQYALNNKAHRGIMLVEISKGMYGLPQAGILAFNQLKTHLTTHDYATCTHTPGLWTHSKTSQPSSNTQSHRHHTTAPSTPSAPSCETSWHPPPKQNSAPSSKTLATVSLSVLHLRKWDIRKLPHPSRPTMHAPVASPIKQSNNAAPKPLTWYLSCSVGHALSLYCATHHFDIATVVEYDPTWR